MRNSTARTCWWCAIAVMSVLAPDLVAAPVMEAGRAEQKFRAIYTDEWRWRVEQLGIDDDVTAPMPDRFPDASAQAQLARLQRLEETNDQLARIDVAALTDEVRVDYLVYRAQIEALAARFRCRDYEMPLNSSGGFWSRAASYAGGKFDRSSDYHTYLSLLRSLPAYFEQNIANMRAGQARGFTPAGVVLVGRESAVASVADSAPDKTVFYKPFQHMPVSMPPVEQAELRAEAEVVMRDAVIPAYRQLLNYLHEDYLPDARASIAARELPDGAAYYRSKIAEYVTLDLDPESIHQTGLREVAAIRGRMEQVKASTGFRGDLGQFMEFLRTEPRFYPGTEKELLKEAAWIANRFDGVSSKWFGHMPRMRFGIRAMPEESAPFSSYALGGPGYYLLNTYNLSSRPLYVLTALTLHEGAPGHAFQMPLAAENTKRPEFRQKVYMSAYGEGWALYCEKLGVEMGMYETPYDEFGMLNYQAWRAARLVVDTGIHWKGWSRQQAVDYLETNTSLNEHEIGTEVDRYISNPGQALSYYMGQLAIEHERRRIEQAQGQGFDIRRFHDAVLDAGSVPLSVLPIHIDMYLARLAKDGAAP